MKTSPKCILLVMLLAQALLLPMLGSMSVSGTCIDAERNALLELKKSFIDKAECLSSWSGENCCQWVGVSCSNITGHVLTLKLRNPRLDDSGHCKFSDDNDYDELPGRAWLGGVINPSLSHLEHLELLDLSHNYLSGLFPSSIGSLNHLRYLDLSQNNFTGPIPTSIGLLSELEWLDVADSSLTGTVSELHFDEVVRLKMLSLHSNKLTMNVSHQWVPPFQLESLYIGSCIVGPEFPSWLKTQRHLKAMNLSSTGISGNIPGSFESMLTSVAFLDLSKNEIGGKVPEIHESHRYVALHSNKFERLFNLFPPCIHFLDLSNNLLSGNFPPKDEIRQYSDAIGGGRGSSYFIFANNNLTGPVPEYFCFLQPFIVDLSSNQLSGELDSCFGYIQTLQVLDLSNNSLHGQIPSDFGSGSRAIRFLHLSNNRFHGKLPPTLQNFNNLHTLDLSRNAFTGVLPQWLGKLTEVKVVNLQSNNFYGDIPKTFCKLKHLQLLHLGQNNITGTIPPCFGNFTAMTTSSLGYPIITPRTSYMNVIWDNFQDNLEVSFGGLNRRYTSSLPFLISMDLSSNDIVGNIPPELTNLLELKNLNLSRNRLEGKIPEKIGDLKKVESLDLSQNKLSGVIPSSLSGLSFISHLNLSFNNFSGRIPTGNQLQTLEDPSIYMGNNQLCGKPLVQKCPDDDGNESSDEGRLHFDESVPQDKEDDSERLWFYAGIGPGFWVGLLGFCSVLHFNETWRHAFFVFLKMDTTGWWYKLL